MELNLSNGQKKIFELTLENFYQLRYNISKVLKDIQDLEKTPILKITK